MRASSIEHRDAYQKSTTNDYLLNRERGVVIVVVVVCARPIRINDSPSSVRTHTHTHLILSSRSCFFRLSTSTNIKKTHTRNITFLINDRRASKCACISCLVVFTKWVGNGPFAVSRHHETSDPGPEMECHHPPFQKRLKLLRGSYSGGRLN